MSNRADAVAITDGATTYAAVEHARLYVWNPNTLLWERMTQPGSSGGGGGPATIADGADVAQGTTTDASTANTVVGILKAIKAAVQGTLTVATHAVTQSGVWTVQPGNTANTTAWKVDGSAVTQPVSGTFWQATQPVSGTFWQATQPVSGTFWQATQPVSGTVTVTPPTLTKGTQGATGFSVQELHDAGRNTRNFMLDAITVAPVAEAVQTVVQWYGNAAVAGTTQPAVVPAGKTLRLTGYKIMYQSLATVGYAVVRIRANTGGLGVLASPLVASFESGTNSGATTTAVTGAVTTETGEFPDGLELPAGTGLAFSMAGYGPTGTLTLEGGVRFQVFGYEY